MTTSSTEGRQAWDRWNNLVVVASKVKEYPFETLTPNPPGIMEVSCQICSIPSTTHRLVFRTSSVFSTNQFRRRSSSSRNINICFASSSSSSNSDTLVAGNSLDIVSKKEDETADLKSWMDQNGLPPCKVLLKDRPCRVIARPIHYVAASQDLQVQDPTTTTLLPPPSYSILFYSICYVSVNLLLTSLIFLYLRRKVILRFLFPVDW